MIRIYRVAMMKRILLLFISFILTPLLLSAQTVLSMKIDGPINPVTAEFIHRSIDKATQENAQCLVIHLNTPGGLLKSTRMIVGDILESPVPVVVYISPGGARAGSAGVFITLAAHIAAMAPGTNIGAAHPVGMQGKVDTIMNEKITNDAAAFIRTIAEKRKRNWQWAEEAVRKSISITETEAIEKNVVNLIAKNTGDLLRQVDGREVILDSAGVVTLHTKDAQVETVEMKTAEKLLSILSDPNIMYVLLMLGTFGLLFELFNPGALFPGITGVICLVLAFYSMSVLPVNYAGLALIIFGIVLFVLEIKIISHGMLAIGGIVSLFLGSIMLIRAESSFDIIKISMSVIICTVILSALFFIFIIGMGLRAQRPKPVTGIDGLVGETGESLEILAPTGTVRVHGELWQAKSVAGVIGEGEKIRVVALRNLKLHVEPVNNNESKKNAL